MDIIEKVARAICAEDLFETGYPQYMVDEWVNRGDWKRWVPVAEAAIKAVRESEAYIPHRLPNEALAAITSGSQATITYIWSLLMQIDDLKKAGS